MPAALLPALIIAVLFSASITIAAHYLHPPRPWLVYIFKPLTTILILLIALLPGSFLHDAYARLIVLGLLFSLSGDIWLMLPGDRFVPGLASFLLTHLCYAYAFRGGASSPDFALVLVLLFMFASAVVRYLLPGVPKSLRLPVLVYMLAITAMVALAVGSAFIVIDHLSLAAQGARLPRISLAPLWAGLGALLFMASDTMLAINRFRRPFKLAQAAVLGTYFAGQTLIALST